MYNSLYYEQIYLTNDLIAEFDNRQLFFPAT